MTDQQQTERRPPVPADARCGGVPGVSVIIPCYNEAAILPSTIERLRAHWQERRTETVEVLVVVDGSTDDTVSRATAKARDWAAVTVIDLGRNCGKGRALREGLRAARGERICLLDADLAYGPETVDSLLAQLRPGPAAAVFGTRFLSPAGDDAFPRWRRWARRLLARVTAFLLFGERLDTQCGCKVLNRAAARLVAAETVLDGFSFDLEMLAVLRAHQVPVAWQPVTADEVRSESRVRPWRDGVRLGRDLWRLTRRFHRP